MVLLLVDYVFFKCPKGRNIPQAPLEGCTNMPVPSALSPSEGCTNMPVFYALSPSEGCTNMPVPSALSPSEGCTNMPVPSALSPSKNSVSKEYPRTKPYIYSCFLPSSFAAERQEYARRSRASEEVMRDRMLEARELVEEEKIVKRELTSGTSI